MTKAEQNSTFEPPDRLSVGTQACPCELELSRPETTVPEMKTEEPSSRFEPAARLSVGLEACDAITAGPSRFTAGAVDDAPSF